MVLIESVSGSVILAHDGVLKFSRVHNNGNELQVYNYTACITTAPLFKWNEDKALHNLQLIFEKDISNRRGFLLHQSKTHWRFGVEQLQDFVQCLIYCIIFVDKFHLDFEAKIILKRNAVRFKHIKCGKKSDSICKSYLGKFYIKRKY
ncbi:hypothetical protein T4B_8685 [Trichinella pseudospiralis]|uniref:Uncharacterized protein n=1 Tax=Trichinella pseudospiralis TaxID=6337 RepID=A0A0V1EZY6_TRIPS|nr:hypothetical protein T4A_7325 [Trichinella pseudospiralis]KRZ27053.1 hypothetical protein T4B_8685 [Trichinella pseudospiralis]